MKLILHSCVQLDTLFPNDNTNAYTFEKWTRPRFQHLANEHKIYVYF
jgi:hypothetical protein